MIITDVTYSRKKNLGNYESEDITLGARIEEGESVESCLLVLKDRVAVAFGEKEVTQAAPVATQEVKEEVVVADKDEVEANKKKIAADKKKEVNAAKKKAEAAAKKEATAAAKAAEKEVKKEAKKAATVPYDRNNVSHKTDLGKVLAGINANWKTECAGLAKQASVELAGKPFYNSDGVVLPEFVEMVKGYITTDL
jgi:hypothetical protein